MGILCLSLTTQAQQSKITGFVKDPNGNPMELANVMAFYKADSVVASFGITDADGRFLLKVKLDEEYFVKCSYIGYENWETELWVESDSIYYSILMKESAMNLEGVEVVYEFPITLSGDTITYKTNAFTNGKERKLGDVLEKLPGVEVDKDGAIKVQGKTVDKVLVEGKEFFDGDSKMAVENIPADVIDNIDVINNYSEVSQMQGLNNDESIALNIQLKDGEKNIWFGDIEAGAGLEDRYLVHPNLFFYSPKTSVNFIGDINNVGEQAFSMQDYFRFNGGFESISRRGGSSLSLSSDELGLAMMQNDKSYYSETSLAALNITHQVNKKLSISAYGLFSGVNNQLKTRSLRNYLGTQGNRTELSESELNQNLGSGLLKFEAKYKPSSALQMSYQAFAKVSSINDEDSRLSSFGEDENTILENNSRDPYSIEQKFDLFTTLNSKNILSAEASWMHKKQRPGYYLQTETKPFDGVLPLIDNELYRLQQNRDILTDQIESALNYYYLINPRNHINITAGVNALFQEYQSSIQQLFDSENTLTLDPDQFSNDATYRFYDTYLSAHYKTKIGKLTVSPGINWHNYLTSDLQATDKSEATKSLWLPDLYMRYEFSGSKSITANYSVNAEYTDVQNIGGATILRNYTSLFNGNRMLQNLWYHNASLSYMNFNMFNFTNFYFMLNYQKRYDDINESVIYNGTDRLSAPTNAVLANEIFMGSGSFQKKFTFMKARIEAQLSYSNLQNTVELDQNRNKSFAQSYTLSAETNFSKWPNLEVGIKTTISNYTSSTLDQQYIDNSPFASIEAIIPGGFVVIADYSYTNYQSDGNTSNSSYDFLNAAVYYRKDKSPWEFKLSGNNLLNTESIRSDSFSDNIISTYEYFVQPAYLMVSVKYDL